MEWRGLNAYFSMSREAQENEDDRNLGYVIKIHYSASRTQVCVTLTCVLRSQPHGVTDQLLCWWNTVIRGCNWLHVFSFNNRERLRGLLVSIPHTRTRRLVSRLLRNTQSFARPCQCSPFQAQSGSTCSGQLTYNEVCLFGSYLSSEYPQRCNIAVLIQFCSFSCFECSIKKQPRLALDVDVNLHGSPGWLSKWCLCLGQCGSCMLEEEFVLSHPKLQITKWWMHALMFIMSFSPSQLNQGLVQNVPRCLCLAVVWVASSRAAGPCAMEVLLCPLFRCSRSTHWSSGYHLYLQNKRHLWRGLQPQGSSSVWGQNGSPSLHWLCYRRNPV